MLDDTALVLVDLETTGLSAARDRITEIAVLRIEPDGSRSRWQSLINPGRSIPESIQSLTGIDNDMVRQAPAFGDIEAELWDWLEGAILIAHNARFDYSFLRQAFDACNRAYRPRIGCTVKLARKLFPQWSRYSLDALCQRIDYHREVSHRAMADVDAMAAFLDFCEQSQGRERLTECLKAQWRLPALPAHLDPNLMDTMPDGCGVYRFYGDDDVLLYVGKSKQLRTRVLSHFSADHSSSREMQLSRAVRHIEWSETAGELGALLQENREIKERSPVYNRRQRQYRSLWCYRLEHNGEGYLVPRLEGRPGEDLGGDESLYGLFRNRSAARKSLEKVASEAGLCKKTLGLESGKGPCFARQLKRCGGACTGEQAAEVHNLKLQTALQKDLIKPWPWSGPVVVKEAAQSGRCALHLLYHWSWLGSVETDGQDPDPQSLHSLPRRTAFDIETYRILLRHLPAMTVEPLP